MNLQIYDYATAYHTTSKVHNHLLDSYNKGTNDMLFDTYYFIYIQFLCNKECKNNIHLYAHCALVLQINTSSCIRYLLLNLIIKYFHFLALGSLWSHTDQFS